MECIVVMEQVVQKIVSVRHEMDSVCHVHEMDVLLCVKMSIVVMELSRNESVKNVIWDQNVSKDRSYQTEIIDHDLFVLMTLQFVEILEIVNL